jgi:5'-nucleotidase
VLLGYKGIALSTPAGNEAPHFESLMPYVEEALELLLSKDGLWLYNVNFPPRPAGIKLTRQSVRQYDGKVMEIKDPYGRQLYWLMVTPLEAAEAGTDRWAVENGFTSITPLRLDLTDEALLQQELRGK